MLKSRLTLFTLSAASVLIALSSATAGAQTYATPSAAATQAARVSGPCRDPWVTLAIKEVTGRRSNGIGNYGECNIALYNNGSWSSYQELARAVQKAQDALTSAGVRFQMSNVGGNAEIKLWDGNYVADKTVLKVVSNDSASLISHDGGSLVATGGGNYTVQSTGGEKRVGLGKSVLIIKKK